MGRGKRKFRNQAWVMTDLKTAIILNQHDGPGASPASTAAILSGPLDEISASLLTCDGHEGPEDRLFMHLEREQEE